MDGGTRRRGVAPWRLALRLARRDARRHWVRSLLVALLIAAPVAAATTVDIRARSARPVADYTGAEYDFGGADAHIRTVWSPANIKSADMPAEDVTGVLSLLPAGSRAVPEPSARNSGVIVTAAEGRTSSGRLVALRLGDPLTRHHGRLVSGDPPRAADEAAVSPSLAFELDLLDRGQLLPDARIAVGDHGIRVIGLVRDPFCLDCGLVVVPPGSPLSERSGPGGGTLPIGTGDLLVDLPPATDLQSVRNALSARDWALSARGEHEDRPPLDLGYVWDYQRQHAGIVVLLVGLALLQIVLLAATAFAVVGRGSARALALVAVQGGSRRDLRRVALGQGLGLGASGAAAGVGLGFAAAHILRSGWERDANVAVESLHAGPWELGVAVAVGVLSCLAAAAVPATAASRRAPLDALAGRVRVRAGAVRARAVVGGALLAAGAGIAAAGSRALERGLVPEESRLDGVAVAADLTGRDTQFTRALVVLAGACAVVAGLVLLTPAIVGGLGRVGRRLPIGGRLALRDVARNRHRTAPAMSAVAVATGGAVVLSLFFVNLGHAQDLRRIPELPTGSVLVSQGRGALGSLDRPERERVAALTAVLPGARAISLDRVGLEPYGCQAGTARAAGAKPLPCDTGPKPPVPVTPAPGIGDPAVLALVAGSPDATAALAAAVTAGKVVVFDPSLLDSDGNVWIHTGKSRGEPRFTRLPGAVLERTSRYWALPDAWVGPATARGEGWHVRHGGTLLAHDPVTTDAARRALTDVQGPAPADPDRPGLRRTVLAAATVLALIGVALPLALSGAEARGSAATLAAVGTGPRRRRRIGAAQALVIAGVGTFLGVGLGLGLARAARPATGSLQTVVPWTDLATLVGAVLVLALAAGLAGAARSPADPRRAD